MQVIALNQKEHSQTVHNLLDRNSEHEEALILAGRMPHSSVPYKAAPAFEFAVGRGGYLGGTGGTVPQKIWGGETAHALVPQYFREVVLSNACESTNKVKKWCYQGILFRNSGFSGEEKVVYDI